jgi:hypothetical protein
VRLRLLGESGRTDEALTVAERLLDQAPRHAAIAPAVELAWAAGRLGNAETVRGWIDRMPYRSPWNDAARAILDDDLGRAADLFAAIGSLPDEAYARLRAGDPANVQRALDFYRSVGASRYIREAEALLAMTA